MKKSLDGAEDLVNTAVLDEIIKAIPVKKTLDGAEDLEFLKLEKLLSLKNLVRYFLFLLKRLEFLKQIVSVFFVHLQNQNRFYFGPVNIRRLQVQLYTDKGNILDLNNKDWTFKFIVEQLYKK